MLWADHEATGKAYELGSFLSDTSNRVVLELRRTGDPCAHVTALALAGLAALVFALTYIVENVDDKQIIAFAGPLFGAVGISVTSIGRTLRKSLDARAELLWNTALVEVISQKTLHVDELLPQPHVRHAWLAPPAPLRSMALFQTDRLA